MASYEQVTVLTHISNERESDMSNEGDGGLPRFGNK